MFESGRPIAHVAADLGTRPVAAKRVRQTEADAGGRADLLSTEEGEELRRLRSPNPRRSPVEIGNWRPLHQECGNLVRSDESRTAGDDTRFPASGGLSDFRSDGESLRHPGRHASRERLRKLGKAARLARVRRFRRAARHGVAAAIEHEAVPLPPSIRTVLDVGSHRGQFAVLALNRFPSARVLCFEPLSGARQVLQEVVEADSARVQIFPFAAGAISELSEIHVSNADDSSSLFSINERHVTAFPGTEELTVAPVRTVRIDEVVESVEEPCLMKIDVQGYELQVLQGAEKLLPRVGYLLVECSFTELYVGQALAGEVVTYLQARGYRFAGIYSLKRDRAGCCLQADFLFELG